MKAIYISQNKSSHKKIWLLSFFLIISASVLCMRVMAPYAIEAWINKSGPNKMGYATRIGDIDFKFFKGEIFLKNVEVFDTLTKMDFAEAFNVKVDFHFLDHLRGEKFLDVTADHVNLILNNEILEQFKSLSSKADGNYRAYINELVISQRFDNKTQKIFTLNHTVMNVKNNSFNLESKISDGGSVELKGEKKMIEGKLINIPSVIVERLSEDELPVEIRDNKMNAAISALHDKDGITGTIRPESNNFRLVEELRPKPRVWWEKKKEFDPLVIEIPFTLKENFTLDFNPTVEELKKRHL